VERRRAALPIPNFDIAATSAEDRAFRYIRRENVAVRKNSPH
jgi:hypothetical protein